MSSLTSSRSHILQIPSGEIIAVIEEYCKPSGNPEWGLNSLIEVFERIYRIIQSIH